MAPDMRLTVIGGGLAGCEAAWQAALRGCRVTLHEMRPERFSPAHRTPYLAELVCSNSLKAESIENASGLLKQELRLCGSLILAQADRMRVPAGGALAVDRERFARAVTEAVTHHPAITVVRGEVRDLPDQGVVIVATGPLTSDALAERLQELVGSRFLYFHDAISPIVEADSIDRTRMFAASRYDKAGPDYLNCPMTREQYYAFIEALLGAQKVPLREFETLIPFEGCMPIEVMAERGKETLAHGPLKPVGLIDPVTGEQPYAVVQLRQENQEATLYSLVGCQTRLTWSEQKRVFALIPGLEQATFARYGSLHRNTFINAPRLLLKTMQLKTQPRIFFAGQITGVEGYCESTAIGLVAGIQASRYVANKDPLVPPPSTMIGALLAFITESDDAHFQPMNANFGLLPKLSGRVFRNDRKRLLAQRALEDIAQWIGKTKTDC
ncbi:MAG: methylenetetrahydrofolate--tRNA-(uracil(54)-C(5))-methyltransferase (FADH(2)-oxidizing) TrmFO [Desulfobacterota bacterium]|nr:methylenetetrahydrofolate--tRNA-(uracil(54)-C(5))-methyltransferase (FADH(2)-oxidizing) TrmFO [Thermodesulfobacteriota bacterium]